MKQWKVTITALEPLSIAREPGTNSYWETGLFIPGSTWRGALAAEWSYKAGFDHPLTDAFFHSSIFRDAHPESAELTGSDILFNKKTYEKVSVLAEYIQNKVISVKDKEENSLLPADAGWSSDKTILNRRVGIEISPERNAAIHGQLYSHTSVAEGTVFHTTAVLPEEAVQLITEKQENQIHSLTCFIGKKKSSGFGKVRIELSEATRSETVETMKKRIDEYSQNLQKNNGWYVQIRSLSPLILFDEYLRYTNTLTTEHLTAGYAKKSDIEKLFEQKALVSWGTSSIRHGWNSKWNTPKQADWVLDPGTLHVYHFPELKDDTEKQLLAEFLIYLEQSGLGERTSEGFGQVDICCLPVQKKKSTEESNGNAAYRDMRRELIEKAIHFTNALPDDGLKVTQLHALYSYPKTEIVKEILDTDEKRYIERRLQRRTYNAWKSKVFYKGQEKQAGEHLREIVQSLKDEFGYKQAGDYTRQFIGYIVTQYDISGKGKRKGVRHGSH